MRASLFLLLLSLTVSTGLNLFAAGVARAGGDVSRYPERPCRMPQSNSVIDLGNSDDLFFAGRALSRAGRLLDGIECLNRAKQIAPDYLDVRLELMNSFHDLGDRVSGMQEAYDLSFFPLTPYYRQTFETYYRKLFRLGAGFRPIPGFCYLWVAPRTTDAPYRRVRDEVVVNEEGILQALELRALGRFAEAWQVMSQRVLPYNSQSATAQFYGAACAWNAGYPDAAAYHYSSALQLAGFKEDFVLGLARALNASYRASDAYRVIVAYRPYFIAYGCFQLGTALYDSLSVIAPLRAQQLALVLNLSLWNGSDDPALCRELGRF